MSKTHTQHHPVGSFSGSLFLLLLYQTDLNFCCEKMTVLLVFGQDLAGESSQTTSYRKLFLAIERKKMKTICVCLCCALHKEWLC